MTYSIKEVFYTLQGEGYHAGTPAVFVRFSGCNLWSGKAEHRARDAARHGAECPKWCDTDFADGDRMDSARVAALALAEVQQKGVDTPDDVPLVVLTGGEPLLQVDRSMVIALRFAFRNAVLAVETNGTVLPKVPVGVRDGLDWICVSPKLPADRLKLATGDELKVVVPAYNPAEYINVAAGFDHLYVSAEAHTYDIGRSVVVGDNLKRAAAWCMENPDWKLTLQSHKIIGVP